jgi:serine/threonine-protein kinase
MASVHAAIRFGAAGFERLVVVKRLHPHLAADEEVQVRFREEGKTAASIRHPSVVPTLDVLDLGGELLLVQDYVEGVTLADCLKAVRREGARLPPALAVRIAIDLLAALHAAHEATDLDGQRLELVHRDVSPQNALVDVHGITRLVDFGISRSATHQTAGLKLHGKIPYMSPEQANGAPLDRRSDVFSMGIVLHEALTGERLFRGSDTDQLIVAVLACEVAAPSTVASGLPPELDAVLLRALSRDRDKRYSTAAEFGAALHHALAPAAQHDVAEWVREHCGDILEARREMLEEGTRQVRVGASSADASTAVINAHQRQSSRKPAVIVPIVAALGAAAAIYVFVSRSEDTTAPKSIAKPMPSAEAPRAASIGGGNLACTCDEADTVPAGRDCGRENSFGFEDGTLGGIRQINFDAVRDIKNCPRLRTYCGSRALMMCVRAEVTEPATTTQGLEPVRPSQSWSNVEIRLPSTVEDWAHRELSVRLLFEGPPLHATVEFSMAVPTDEGTDTGILSRRLPFGEVGQWIELRGVVPPAFARTERAYLILRFWRRENEDPKPVIWQGRIFVDELRWSEPLAN